MTPPLHAAAAAAARASHSSLRQGSLGAGWEGYSAGGAESAHPRQAAPSPPPYPEAPPPPLPPPQHQYPTAAPSQKERWDIYEMNPVRCSSPPPRQGGFVGPPQAASKPSLREVMTRLRFSNAAAATYLAAMVLCAVLILIAAATDTMNSLWYRSLEALLTALFAAEIGWRWYLQGDSFLQKYVNVAEVALLAVCLTIFVLSLTNWSSTEGFLEALLLALRYSAQCGRFCFFMRSIAYSRQMDPVELEQHHYGGGAACPPREAHSWRPGGGRAPAAHCLLAAPAHLRAEYDDGESDDSALAPPRLSDHSR
eukprot:TRINITY_DN71471_c0_g1_i1.p2 TRINITY_DN71471_c0_g1~~TRINITY_DN71471_c0_g1_i1.p2  ORF type:complete len:310 (+),score=110.46 TRINITY_DN71471_c0_g1_i1:80-1009(+)